MVKSSGLAAAAALLLASSPLVSGMYSQSSPVLQVTARSYDNLIAQSNHTSIVEFYAPWCGHCKNLKPAYEKAAKSLSGLAKVAAIDCDDGSNKPFCSSMGVQGFPTLKIVRPGKKEGRPIVEDYNGARTAKAIVDAVIDKIPNHVKRLKDNDYLPWIGQDDEPRAILVTEKGTVSPLFKSVAIDFLGSISFAQIRDKEAKAVETLGIEKIPTLLLLPGLDKEAVKYEGEMKRDAIVAFLSQVAPPNQPKTSDTKKAKASKADQKKAASSKAGDSAESAVPKEAKTKPPKAPEVAPPIKSLPNENALLRKCLNDKAGTCILVFLPQEGAASASAQQAIDSLSQIHFKHGKGNKSLFPFYQVPASLPAADGLRKQFNIDTPTVEIISVNGKRAWWRRYPSDNFQMQEIEAWVDAIRMGDLPKQTLPDHLIADASTLPPEPVEQADDAPPDIKAMRDAFKASMPEGMDIELEEVSDEDYERIMKGNAQAANDGHDEL